ncbi:GTP cyclohydrolase I FolE [Secundilactobacillus folii]|uniref:GTP cyclohydrolase 1 n=1 Tax=Secundilactobacillus folii TaxID=2678357 RepID=A0A7X2XYW5_9LACO|nr:GTP cyclohydrolase I FolE [Secundilactobacillus folii]MTV82866.1 GTP cyclohydrolase I FolE [Secundilactobacillus folii]
MMDETNQKKIEQAVKMILEAVGEDPNRDGLQETPARVARMYSQVFASVNAPAFDNYKLFPVEETTEMVLIKDIPFYSMCEHHLLPFFGQVHVAYIPDHKRVMGLSKIPRLIDYCAKRPNVQERMTVNIAKELNRILDPKGIAVSVSARHMCMEMRGVEKTGSQTESSYYTGQFKTDNELRREFLQRISG